MEFKSSIVFPADEYGPNIGKQLGVICRSIAGFMNAEGGTLYIGVSDSGYICGIENDYGHLNDNEHDTYVYKADDDGYQQVLSNAICRILGNNAGTLVDINFRKEDGKKYCVVKIRKSSCPVWFSEEKLFVRINSTTRQIKGNDATNFIQDRGRRHGKIFKLWQFIDDLVGVGA
jgi:predicted HTH transcriptional regulator